MESREITQKDFIDAFTKRPDDAGPMPVEELLRRLDISLGTLKGETPPKPKDAANVLRGALIRLAQAYDHPEVTAKVNEIVTRTAAITGL